MLRNKIAIVLYFIVAGAALPLLSQPNWQKVGNGLSYEAFDLFTDKSNDLLYISGYFEKADTMACHGIAYWDGSNFHKLPPPVLNSSGYSTTFNLVRRYNGTLFSIGSYFVNNKQTTLIKYNANQWLADCPSRPYVNLSRIKIINNKLFLLGDYDTLCQKLSPCISVYNGAGWDPFQTINPLDLHYNIYTGELFNGEYFFAGSFNHNGHSGVIRWDGSQWTCPGGGLKGGIGWIEFMVAYKGLLYVGGYFLQKDGNAANFIQAWDGTQWINPFPQVTFLDKIRDLKVMDNKLYISGNHIVLADNDSLMYSLARYDGCHFEPFGLKRKFPEYKNAPWCIELYKGRLYAGLDMDDTLINGQRTNYLISFDGNIKSYRTISVDSCPVYGSSGTPFTVFPTVFSNNITIQLQNTLPLTNTEIQLYNSLGQKVFSYFPQSYNFSIDLAFLSGGAYFLAAQSPNSLQTKKIIKQ